MNNLNLEILSPAGNPESFLAALNNEADAIYLGLNSFNARMRAENFTKENIREYIKLAHSFGTKVYITINTLLNDDDFDELVSLVDCLTQAKADAFIVQDLGVAYILKKCFKNIVLHASTQMGIHNLEGAMVAKQLGFSRIVLSRETTLEDIEEIHKNTDLEIEYFIQGALCVAFSGNCYLSSIENNASGNEGKCLQLCRLPYKNSITKETKYYLSPRDLSLLENLPKLIKAGVTSFKIEGRMKHSGYVAICTKLYKNALNLIKNNNFNNKFLLDANNILKKTFSRGDFNKNAYLLKNNENNIINSSFQNHIGIEIGTVEEVKSFKQNLYSIIIKSSHILNNGDGLKFIDKNNKQISSIGVGNVEKLSDDKYKIISKQKLVKGLKVCLIQDSNLENLFLKNTRQILLNLNIIANKNEKLKITAFNDNFSFDYYTDEILSPANTSPLSQNNISEQFLKTSNSIFQIQNINVSTNGIFAPKGLLNNIRRKLLTNLQEYIIFKNEEMLNIEFDPDNYLKLKTQKTINYPENLIICDEFNNNIEKKHIQIIFPNDYLKFLNNYNFENNFSKNNVLFLPTIINYNDKKIINKILDKLPTNSTLFVNNISGLYYKIFKNYEIITSPLLNIKNKFAILCLNELNVNKICASIETDLDFSSNHNLISFSDGLFPLMTFAHCPYKAIFENNCNSCKFDNSLSYTSQSNKNYIIRKYKLNNCYFMLMKNLNRKNCKYSLKNLKDY